MEVFQECLQCLPIVLLNLCFGGAPGKGFSQYSWLLYENIFVLTSQSLSEVFGSHLSLFVWISHRFRRSGSVGNRKNCGLGFVLE